MANDFLEQNGSAERIDHRSNAERGIDEIPTVHMGVAACQMEKKGFPESPCCPDSDSFPYDASYPENIIVFIIL